MQRMAERARKLEAQNVGDKEWFMRGEADSGPSLVLSEAVSLNPPTLSHCTCRGCPLTDSWSLTER